MSNSQHGDRLRSRDISLNLCLLVVTLIEIVTLYVAIIRPIDWQLSEAGRQSRELEQLIRQTSEIALQHQTLKAELDEAETATAALLQRIPTAPRESDFLAHVCQLADRTGMTVANYHPGAIEVRENHHEMEVKLSTRGEYASLCKFLEQVDHLPRLCRLTQLDVTTPSTGDHLAVDLLFRIYFAPPSDGDVAKADAARKG